MDITVLIFLGVATSQDIQRYNPSDPNSPFLQIDVSDIDPNSYSIYYGLEYPEWPYAYVRGKDYIVPVTGLNISQSSLAMKMGTTSDLSAQINPPCATNKSVIWSSDNPHN